MGKFSRRALHKTFYPMSSIVNIFRPDKHATAGTPAQKPAPSRQHSQGLWTSSEPASPHIIQIIGSATNIATALYPEGKAAKVCLRQ